MNKFVGINGFGRIGRAVFRKVLETEDFDIVVINEINPDNKNIAYQLKYDSLYGTLKESVSSDERGIIVNGKQIVVHHEKNIDEVPWERYGVSRIIDCSGVFENVVRSRNLRKRNIKQVIITHSPDEKVLVDSQSFGNSVWDKGNNPNLYRGRFTNYIENRALDVSRSPLNFSTNRRISATFNTKTFNVGPLGRRCLYAQLNDHESSAVYHVGLQENGLWDILPACVAAEFTTAKIYDGNGNRISFTDYALTPNKGVILIKGTEFEWINQH